MGVTLKRVGGTTMVKAHMGKRSQIVLPKVIVDELNLTEGTEFEVVVVDGKVQMEPIISIPRSQAWYWTESWQIAEREADLDIEQGRIKGPFKTTKELFASLDED